MFIIHNKSIASLEFECVASEYPDLWIYALHVTFFSPKHPEFGENTLRSVGGEPRECVCMFIIHNKSIASLEFECVASEYPDIWICALRTTLYTQKPPEFGDNT